MRIQTGVQPHVFQQRTASSQGGLCRSSKSRQKHGTLSLVCWCKTKFWSIVLCTHRGLPTRLQDLCSTYTPHVHEQGDYSSPVARALRQPRRAPRVLVSRPQRLYVNLAVRREYSSIGRSGSTSTTPYATATSSSGRTTTSTTYLD
jgi:hypothetical protein